MPVHFCCMIHNFFIPVSTPTAHSDLLIRDRVHFACMITHCAYMNMHCACMFMHHTCVNMKHTSDALQCTTFFLVQLHFIPVSTPTAHCDLLIRDSAQCACTITHCACMEMPCAYMSMHCTCVIVKHASIPMHQFLSSSAALYPGVDPDCSLRFVDP